MGNKTRSKDVERDAAHLLTNKTDEYWQRVPQSGATATQHNTGSHVFNGDVFNEGTWSDVCVEVKKMKNMKARHVFQPTRKIEKHLEQARDESDGKHLLMMKINYQGWFLYLPVDEIDKQPTFNLHFQFEDEYDKDQTVLVEDGRGNLYKLFYIGKQ